MTTNTLQKGTVKEIEIFTQMLNMMRYLTILKHDQQTEKLYGN